MNITDTHINRLQPMPLYYQVYEKLRQQITDGTWRKGDLIPPIPSLTSQFNVAAITIRQAIRLLQDEGLVLSERGRGTTVTASFSKDKPLYLESSASQLLDLYADDSPELETINEGVGQPPAEGDNFSLALSYYFLTRAHIRNATRYCLITIYIENQIFLANENAFRERLALPVLFGMQNLEMKRAWQTLTIEKANQESANNLRIPLNDPVAHVKRYITNTQGELIYFADVRYRADCVQYSMELRI
ncbi:GntR family transcriptional regulator [Alphaproteobacteria bacterium]|nr:GntR family transcriptional regulator [Alphaproteobacteria bacterium]